MNNKTKMANIESAYNTINKKALKKAELIQQEIKNNVDYNLYNDGLILF